MTALRLIKINIFLMGSKFSLLKTLKWKLQPTQQNIFIICFYKIKFEAYLRVFKSTINILYEYDAIYVFVLIMMKTSFFKCASLIRRYKYRYYERTPSLTGKGVFLNVDEFCCVTFGNKWKRVKVKRTKYT